MSFLLALSNVSYEKPYFSEMKNGIWINNENADSVLFFIDKTSFLHFLLGIRWNLNEKYKHKKSETLDSKPQ